MTLNQFNLSISEIRKLLNLVNYTKDDKILKHKGIKVLNTDGVSQEYKSASQKSTYFEMYMVGKNQFDYDFLLIDESYFQFTREDSEHQYPTLRYAFLQNPQEFISYKDYLSLNEILEEECEDVNFIEEYEQYLNEAELNSSSLMLRFDLEFNGYEPMIHSLGHFHFGHKNSIRVPCDKIITPLAFSIFVLRHFYPIQWKLFKQTKHYQVFSNYKSQCINLNEEFWTNDEKMDLFLT